VITTVSPTERPCAAEVRTVTVFPTSVRPGAFRVIVPPPVLARPVAGLVKVNDRVVGTVSTVHVPLYSGTGTPEIVTTSPGCSVCVGPAAPVEIVTVWPSSVAPPSCVALGAAPIVTVSGWIVEARW
jgi:hypothetical protein